MSEMVKRIAGQFCFFGNHDAKHSCCRGSGGPKECERTAARVIALMREPTDAMTSVECPMTMGMDHLFVSEDDAAAFWRAMIDEALK
jgi:hypothetical protein